MKTDEIKPGAANAANEGDLQNRREFFNGLGKWSMIVVAAVSFLGGARDALARKKKPRYHKHDKSVVWSNVPHNKYPRYHKDTGPARVQPGGGEPLAPPPAKKTYE